MKLITMQEIIEKTGYSKEHVRSCYQWGLLGGQRVAGVWVSTKEQFDAWHNTRPAPSAPELFGVKDAAAILGVSTRQIRKATKNGTLPAMKIKSVGKQGWAWVYDKEDLAKAELTIDKPGPEPKGDADKYIITVDGRYVIKGTHNRKGLPYNYKNLRVARRRTRAAYGEKLIHVPGDRTKVYMGTPHPVDALILETVTGIDQTIIVAIDGERRILDRRCLELGVLYE